MGYVKACFLQSYIAHTNYKSEYNNYMHCNYIPGNIAHK